MTVPLAFLGSLGGAFDFIFNERESAQEGSGVMVGGLDQVGHLLFTQLWISVIALLIALVIALPLGLYLGHRGAGEFIAVAVANAGRAVPELALIALMLAFLDIGDSNVLVIIAVTILGIPPILTNAFVGVRQVDRDAVAAARGVGMSELDIVRRVELPLALPTIIGGVRTASTNIIATSTIGSIAGVSTLGDLILGQNVYGTDGVVAGAIVVALLALAFEVGLAGLQRVLTPRGVALQRQPARSPA